LFWEEIGKWRVSFLFANFNCCSSVVARSDHTANSHQTS
jgi:hypothetical protein